MSRCSFLLVCCLISSALAIDCSFDEPIDGKFQVCAHQIDTVAIGHNTSLFLYTSQDSYVNQSNLTVELNITIDHGGIVQLDEDTVNITVGDNATILLLGIGAGRTEIRFNYTNVYNDTTGPINGLQHLVRTVSIVHWEPLNIIIAIIGWMYFVAWSISFYPQIFLNIYRRSVVGLNFDFLAFNITGFLAYSVFNIGLFWIPEVEREYFDRNPGGVNPVQLNDVIFAVHASIATLVTIFQCLIFKRDKQRVSIVGSIIIAILWVFMFVSLFVSIGGVLAWLDLLYFISYVKLAVTLIKYVPQVSS
jgi:cystinosin